MSNQAEVAPFHDIIDGCWFRLPMPLRQRWWHETDYGKLPPSDELKQAVRDAARGMKNGN